MSWLSEAVALAAVAAFIAAFGVVADVGATFDVVSSRIGC